MCRCCPLCATELYLSVMCFPCSRLLRCCNSDDGSAWCGWTAECRWLVVYISDNNHWHCLWLFLYSFVTSVLVFYCKLYFIDATAAFGYALRPQRECWGCWRLCLIDIIASKGTKLKKLCTWLLFYFSISFLSQFLFLFFFVFFCKYSR